MFVGGGSHVGVALAVAVVLVVLLLLFFSFCVGAVFFVISVDSAAFLSIIATANVGVVKTRHVTHVFCLLSLFVFFSFLFCSFRAH